MGLFLQLQAQINISSAGVYHKKKKIVLFKFDATVEPKNKSCIAILKPEYFIDINSILTLRSVGMLVNLWSMKSWSMGC